ncbi:dnaJ homolog subfamily C member 28-like isoform X2 [Cynara cardunculus var. scolymus]|uniref:DnaJ-like protein n=1 Tax=Cynara cardunculus var. scolymus TaxID=59895 RepID=A0A118K4R6_CYNCS|nr:dnaJ homolog subfamily C member 28-like isoform X2 [Cynara cardunculus var. scolymus]KVI07966.1 DnaJ-like protein [Cynara cardunculus var. scolymus]
MAARLLKAITIASSSSPPSVSRQMLNEASPLIAIFCPSLSKVRWTSTSSSSEDDSATAARNPNKKISERLSGVIDAVNDRKLPPELRGQRNNVRSETDIMNVVERRIWRSMEEGHFENLPGKGKPLNLNSNPHADPAEDTLYRILSKNKCAPEWVELNKEIRTNVAEWRSTLKKAWARKESGDMSKWFEYSDSLKLQLHSINDKVFRYNLIVPFGRQMLGLKWEKELARLNEVQPGT